jgi:hypothetical protein
VQGLRDKRHKLEAPLRRFLFRLHHVTHPPCSARPSPFQRTHPPRPASISHSGSSQHTPWGPERAIPTFGYTHLRGVPLTLAAHHSRQLGLPSRAGEHFALRPPSLNSLPPSLRSTPSRHSTRSDVQRQGNERFWHRDDSRQLSEARYVRCIAHFPLPLYLINRSC